MAVDPDLWAQAVRDNEHDSSKSVQEWYDYLKGLQGSGSVSSGNMVNGFPDGNVFLGTYNATPGLSNAPRGREDVRTPGTLYAAGDYGPHLVSVADSNNWFLYHYEQQDAVYKRIHQTMLDANLVHPGDDINAQLAQWQQYSILSNMAGNRGARLSPEWYMQHQAAANAATAPVTTTARETTTSTNFSSRADVEGMYQSVAEQALGRRATPGELPAAYGALHGAEAANPQTTRSNRTTVTDAKGNTRTTGSSTSSGGLGQAGAQEVLTQQAMSASDYAEYQAAGVMFPWLLSALGATANVPSG